jgi:hypothetical protein
MIAKTCRESLLAIAWAYAEAKGLTLGQVSKKFYGNTKFLDRLNRGWSAITLEKFDAMIKAFREDWPPNGDWPMTPAIYLDDYRESNPGGKDA